MSAELSKKQMEFFTVMFLIIVGVLTLITIIDIATKTAIIEQATKLRLTIEGYNGSDTGRPDQSGATARLPVDAPIPSDVLDLNAARMEAGSAGNGSKASPANRRQRRPQSPRASRSPEVSGGNKPMGSGEEA